MDVIITSAQFCTNLNGEQSSVKATIEGIEMLVPLDPANRHYAAILEWVADGNTIQEAD